MLSFEASGALKGGSLIMRDRETDSWWSIMTSRAIGGSMEGAPLVEMPVSEKMTWGAWRAMHPESRVLAVTHLERNGYDNYFDSERTFRNLTPEDDRLPPRTNIYVFESGGESVVVRHSTFEGGRIVGPSGGDERVLLYRSPGASLFESTRAYRFPAALEPGDDDDAAALMARLDAMLESPDEAERAGVERIAGMDTFWYNWALQNPESRILE